MMSESSTYRVITIATTNGSGAEETGRLLAEQLGFRYVNEQIVEWAAVQAGVSRAEVEQVEHTPPLVQRILQAIATAKRLGAVIEASDVRPSVKEQVESLGGKFIDVPYETAEEKEAAEGVGGYAKPMPPSWLERQKVEVAKRVAMADIVISTALIPGRAAPTLITEAMVQSMKPGSVIVDMAAPAGGNCPLTEAGKTVVKHGVTIVGETNIPALVATDSSALYARNVLDFLKLILTKEAALAIPTDDDIVTACMVTQGGKVLRS